MRNFTHAGTGMAERFFEMSRALALDKAASGEAVTYKTQGQGTSELETQQDAVDEPIRAMA